MLYKKKHESKAEIFEGSMASFLFLGCLGFVMLISANVVTGMAIYAMSAQQKINFTWDAWVNLGCLAVALLGALIVDARSVFDMFARIAPEASKGELSCHPVVTLYGLQQWARTVSIVTVTINWLTAHGLLCSGLKLFMELPLSTVANSVRTVPETMHDLVAGDVLVNPLIRNWSWEVVYGMVCGLHLSTYFAVSVAHRASFNVRKLAPVAIGYGMVGIALMALAGFFRVRSYADGWIGPADGFWLVFCHLVGLYLAYEQWYNLHPKEAEAEGAEFQEGILAFADEWRGWKPVTVFAITTFLSMIFAYATPIYPLVLALTYAFYWKAHPMDRGWNKILFFLTVTHQVMHYFVHSYRTLEDQPLLFCDKFVHFLYAVVAAQQFREKTELLSRDPLVKAFNYINIFVWIPGDIIAMYISGFHGGDMKYLHHMIGWGGYCLSTGTAMAYVNNDIEEDNAPNSSRRFIGPGVTGHGVQIFQALLFAVLYIVGTGGSQEMGWRIEYLYDYAAHLYTGYGCM